MTTTERYIKEQNAARLNKLVDAKNKAVAAVQAEVDRQQGKRTASTGNQSYSYSITYNPAVQSPQKALTPAMRDAELRKIRSEFERQRQLTILQARVMSQWRDP
jgi:hypothetical protein